MRKKKSGRHGSSAEWCLPMLVNAACILSRHPRHHFCMFPWLMILYLACAWTTNMAGRGFAEWTVCPLPEHLQCICLQSKQVSVLPWMTSADTPTTLVTCLLVLPASPQASMIFSTCPSALHYAGRQPGWVLMPDFCFGPVLRPVSELGLCCRVLHEPSRFVPST